MGVLSEVGGIHKKMNIVFFCVYFRHTPARQIKSGE